MLCVFQGIFISRVTEEGPAGQAGLRVGDKVLAVSAQASCPSQNKAEGKM